MYGAIVQKLHEIHWDILARIIPGLSFVLMLFFTIVSEADISNLIDITTDLNGYQFLLLVVVGYIVGLYLDLTFQWLDGILFRIHNPRIMAQTRRKGVGKLLHRVFKAMFLSSWSAHPTPEDAAEAVRLAGQEQLNNTMSEKEIPDKDGPMFKALRGAMGNYVRLHSPNDAKTLRKISGVGTMFRGFWLSFTAVLVIEVYRHSLNNMAAVVTFGIMSILSLRGYAIYMTHRLERELRFFMASATSRQTPASG